MTLEKMGFTAVVEGVQQYLENVRKMQEAQEREAAALERVARTHQTASQQIQTDNARTAQSAERMGQSSTGIGTMAKNLVAAAAAAASTYVSFKLLATSLETTEKLGEQVHELGLRFGLTAEQGSRLIFTANALNVNSDSLSRGLGILSRNMLQVQETEDGMINTATPAAKVLASLGIAALDSGGKVRPLNDILNDLADVFQKTLTAEQRNGVAMQLFGRSGAELIPILLQGKDGLKQWADQSDRLGNTLSQKQVEDIHQYTLAQKEFQAVIRGIEIDVATGIMPTLTNLGHWFADHRDDVAGFVQNALRYTTMFVTEFVRGMGLVTDALEWLVKNQYTVIGAIVAIGAAFVWVNPVAAAFAGAGGLIALVGLFSEANDTASAATLRLKLHILDMAESGIEAMGELLKLMALASLGPLGLPGAISKVVGGPDLNPFSRPIDALVGGAQSGIDKIANRKGIESALLQATAREQGAAAAKGGGNEGTGIPNLGVDFQNLAKGAAAADDPLKQLAGDFVKTGEVTRKLAERLNLSAEEAGQVEGIDAVIRKQDEAKDKAFAFAETLSKVAEAFRENAQVAGDIVLDLAQKALEAENKAASDVLGRPTREQAALDLREAQLKLQADLVHARVDPQLEILKKRGEQIQKDTDDQVAAIEQQIKQIQSQGPRGASIPPGVHITTGPAPVGPVSDPQQQAINALKAEEAQIKQSGQDRKKAVDDEIASLTKQTTAVDDNTKSVQTQIGLERDRVDIMRKQLTLADQTLLTDAEQRQKVHELSTEISTTSGYVRTLSKDVGKDLVPTMDTARDAFKQVTAAVDVLTNETLRKKLIKDGFDPAAERLAIFKDAVDKATSSLGGLDALGLGNLKGGAGAAGPRSSILNALTGHGHPGNTNPNGYYAGDPRAGGGGGGGSFAEGGFIDRPMIAQLHAREVVIPMTNVSRAQELFAQLPPGFRANMMRSSGAGGSFMVNASATGFTLEDMRAAAHAAVDEAFKQARSSTGRSGSALSGRIG